MIAGPGETGIPDSTWNRDRSFVDISPMPRITTFEPLRMPLRVYTIQCHQSVQPEACASRPTQSQIHQIVEVYAADRAVNPLCSLSEEINYNG